MKSRYYFSKNPVISAILCIAAFFICVNILLVAFVLQQYSVVIATMCILAFVLIEKRRDFLSAATISSAIFTKLYGVIGLVFLPFSKRRLKLMAGLLFWSVAIFIISTITPLPLDSYTRWLETFVPQSCMDVLRSHTDVSLVGVVGDISGWGYSNIVLIIVGIALFVAPYLRINQYDNRSFRVLYLASALLLMVLFGTTSDHCSYIAAIVAVGIWDAITPTRRKTPILNTGLLVLCTLMTSGLYIDILPTYIRTLTVVTYTIVWLKIVWELSTQDFTTTRPTPISAAAKKARMDVILPCYNPHQGWEEFMIAKHRELKAKLNGRDIRLIVVNDGSKSRFTEDAVCRLQQALPDTIVVDCKQNRGKGAAVRAGISHSDSEIAIYTDYDFPYQTDSVCEVVSYLEQGYDVVIANRNQTYHSQLTFNRKVASYASRLLNYLLLGLTHTDTQGGLKGFNNKGKGFLASTKTDQFLFDTEFIYNASLDTTAFIKDVPADLRDNVRLPALRKGVLKKELVNLICIAWRG